MKKHTIHHLTFALSGSHSKELILSQFLQALSTSPAATGFVLAGDLMMEGYLHDQSRNTNKILLITTLLPATAHQMLSRIVATSNLMLSSPEDAPENSISITLIHDSAFILFSHQMIIHGQSITTFTVESAIAALIYLLNNNFNEYTPAYLYDLAALTQTQSIDGRILYETIYELFSRKGADYMQPAIFSHHRSLEREYHSLQKHNTQCTISYHQAISSMRKLLTPVLQSIQHENEFFGLWDFKQQVWNR